MLRKDQAKADETPQSIEKGRAVGTPAVELIDDKAFDNARKIV